MGGSFPSGVDPIPPPDAGGSRTRRALGHRGGRVFRVTQDPAKSPSVLAKYPGRLPVLGLLVVGAGARALHLTGRFDPWTAIDGTRLTIPAIEILRGSLPVHHVGAEYFGAAPSYPLAAWFWLVGASPLAMDLFGYGIGLAVLWTTYLLARRVSDPLETILTLAILAVPAPLLAYFSAHVHLSYSSYLLLGNLVLLATHTLFFQRSRCPCTLFVLGLLAGLGWWTNPLIVIYLAPFGLLALRTGLVRHARAFLFPLGALIGGLPAWLYELAYFPSARFETFRAGEADPGTVLDLGRVTLVGGSFVPSVLGVDRIPTRPSVAALAALAVLLL